MGRLIRGTGRADELAQGGFAEVRIFGLGGNDTIVLDRDDDLGGDNLVDAGKGNDTVVNMFEGGNRIAMGGGNHTYVGTGFSFFGTIDVVTGGAGKDRFFVSTLLSTYEGNKSADIFESHGFRNSFDGGEGTDAISYRFRHEDPVIGDQGVTISLGENRVLTGSNSVETLRSIENAFGSENADLIAGGNGVNVLSGLGGDDEIHGLGDDDSVAGGAGADVLFGEEGADRFVFSSASETAGRGDFLADFSSQQGDRIDLSDIDADTRVAGDQSFQFLTKRPNSGGQGAVFFELGSIHIDVNGDGRSEGIIHVNDISQVSSADFIF